ncbi:hypothetical protein [Allomeiothermus silvanus]|uniref:hypothetical protein n=1 Tax=Allomeiothermus silvanus TaxID=52022 RepID=UPI0023F02D62|nr:hypothetical protein [Allomeiothermus silvanus]
MDTKGWVLRAVEKLRFASEKDIQRWLDEEGETLSREELKKALEFLLREQKLELKSDLYRIKNKEGGKDAFSKLFND